MAKQARATKAAVQKEIVNRKAKTIPGSRVVNFLYERSQRKRATLSAAQREQFVLEYREKARKLGRSILRKWRARLDLDEVDSLVDLSLCEAVRRFNPYVGATFMTFLYYHLRGNLIRAITASASASVVSFNDYEIENVRDGAQYQPNAVEVANALASNDSLAPDEMIFRKEMVGLREKACAKLDNLEREVINRIYVDGQQLMDIAQSMGYSRCHVSRVKKRALETLSREMAEILGPDMPKVNISEDDTDSSRAEKPVRRVVHRRRPRSRAVKQVAAGETALSAAVA